MLELKDESIEFDMEVIAPSIFSNEVRKERTTRKKDPQREKELRKTVRSSRALPWFMDLLTPQTFMRSAGLYEEIQRDTHLVNVEYTWVKDSIVLKYMMGELPDYGTINVWDSCIDLMLQVSLDKELDNMRCIVSTLLHCNGVFIVKLNLPSTLWLVYHV
ncbi:uncharacterized protein E5676_scaffold403G00550 [Cucumis melo var. makuwa]|uniref:Uncharacterized protein n=1 Tax=Cucumis melo var. makuwa TaxID=1194695 RepID=A0A5D3DYB2_CUCMM|nr:uncharacterized protein E5676_scaffold403G00550 [Cucumis melo var. makuwa]